MAETQGISTGEMLQLIVVSICGTTVVALMLLGLVAVIARRVIGGRTIDVSPSDPVVPQSQLQKHVTTRSSSECASFEYTQTPSSPPFRAGCVWSAYFRPQPSGPIIEEVEESIDTPERSVDLQHEVRPAAAELSEHDPICDARADEEAEEGEGDGSEGELASSHDSEATNTRQSEEKPQGRIFGVPSEVRERFAGLLKAVNDPGDCCCFVLLDCNPVRRCSFGDISAVMASRCCGFWHSFLNAYYSFCLLPFSLRSIRS